MRIIYNFNIPFLILICLSTACNTSAQKITGLVQNPAFDKTISSMLDFNVKTISVAEAQKNKEALFLDARENKEFEISHIPGALHIGYAHWSQDSIKNINKDRQLIVYCSIGYRSEKIGKKLKDLGYVHVYNLYGSIFEWANEGMPLVSSDGSKANKIHTYNKSWSKWVSNGEITKVW